MTNKIKNINNIFYIFITAHLILWTLAPSVTNQNLPLDTIEHLAWGSNLDWGFNKHPPMVAFVVEAFYRIFGSQDWAYYLLSQIFVCITFIYVFKLGIEILNNSLLSLISVLLLESIYFYNFTTPEFNVNVCQLPFWSIAVYYSWKIFNQNKINVLDCILLGLFGAIGFLISGSYLKTNLPLSIGFLNVPAFLIFIPITTFMARVGARTVHKIDKNKISKFFGIFLLVIASKFLLEYLKL